MKNSIILLLTLAQLIVAQEFSVKREILSGSNDKKKTALVRYTVFNEDKLLYSIEKNIDYDITYPSAVVNEKGELFLLNAIDASVENYNSAKTNIAHIYLFDKPDIEYERSLYYSLIGDKLIVAVSQPELRTAKIFLLNRYGIISQIEFEKKNIGLIVSSGSGEYFAVSGYNIGADGTDGLTAIYDKDMNQLKRFPRYFTFGEFVSNGEFFLGYTNKYISLLNWRAGNTIESFELSKGRILSAKYFNGSIYLISYLTTGLSEGEWHYQSPKLLKIKNNNLSIIDSNAPEEIKSYKWIYKRDKVGVKYYQ